MRKPPVKWTEALIQNALFCFCAIRRHEIIIPNSRLFGWESDLISVTGSGLIHEFEIKITRADFKADAKKSKMRYFNGDDPPDRHRYLFGRPKSELRPNYFHYVTPPDLIADLDRPGFAGMIEAQYCPPDPRLYHGTVSIVADAPRLHKDKITDWQKRQLTRAATSRFWAARFKLTATPDSAIMDPEIMKP